MQINHLGLCQMCSIKLQAGLYFANSWTKFDRELGPGQDMRLHSWFNGWNGKSSTNKKDVENLVKSLLYSFNNIYQQQHFPEVLSVRLCGQATAGIITWSYNDSRIKMSHHLSRLNKLAKQDKSTNILTHFVCVITVLLQVCFNTLLLFCSNLTKNIFNMSRESNIRTIVHCSAAHSQPISWF